MKEDFVGYDISVKLKEKGFPQIKKGTLAMYNEEGEWYSLSETLDDYYYSFEDFDDKDCVCPTIFQVLKWLREKKNIHIDIGIWDCKYVPLIVYIGVLDENIVHTNKTVDVDNFRLFDTYEQAALAGVNYCLDNLI